MFYSREQLYIHICMQNHKNKDERHSSLEKYTSHFIWKGCVWEGVGDWTELQHIVPHSYGHNSISLPLSWAAQPGTWGLILSGTCSSFQYLLFNCSIGGPEGPGFFSRILSPTGSNFLCIELYYCFTLTQSLPITGQRNMQLPPSLEWHVWSSSSGNNCHAVHRSPSSGASVCDCTMGF